MVSIKSNERVAFVGKTGSGKTYAAQILTKNLTRLVVIDSKGTLGAGSGWNLDDWSDSNRRKMIDGEPVRLRVVAPLDGNYEPYFASCFDAGNVTVYIDEMYAVVGSSNKPGQFLTAMYTRGRELGIGVWASTQRPAWVPLFMLSEADWIFLFRLQMAKDRARVAEIMGDVVRDTALSGHEVYVYNQAWDRPVKYPSIIARTSIGKAKK